MLALLLLLAASHTECRPTTIPESTSFVHLYFDKKHCKRVDETGVSCTKARLLFGEVKVVNSCRVPISDDIVFTEQGRWVGTVHYAPPACKENGKYFDCDNVSWRMAK